MLVFIDESGDSGLKFAEGSSKYFSIGLTLFTENDDAEACDKRIDLIRHELKLPKEYEFHYKDNPTRVREYFIREITTYNFFYYIFHVDKSKLHSRNLKNRETFMKLMMQYLFNNARNHLNNSKVIIDKTGNKNFKRRLSSYLKRKMLEKEIQIKNVNMQASHTNNLLQLADYIVAIEYRVKNGKLKTNDLYKLVTQHKLKPEQTWPC